MNLKERIEVLDQLGKRILAGDEYLDAVIHRTHHRNPWFTKENQVRRLNHIAGNFLQKEKLENWTANYSLSDSPSDKTVALIPSDAIPLENFHDLLSVFVSGHKSVIKLPENDQYLIPCLLKFLKDMDSRTEKFFRISNRLENFDAVITDIGDTSGVHLKTYFGKYPNILREKRSSAAVLTGEESDAQLLKLGDDIFSYFGLSSRNVGKVYFPKGYDLKHFLEITHEFKDIVLNNKYKNNFDYNFAACTLNKEPFHINGCMILVEREAIRSNTTVVHYEFYENTEKLEATLDAYIFPSKKDGPTPRILQNVVSEIDFLNIKTLPFGKTSTPELDDYLDKRDTLKFLSEL